MRHRGRAAPSGGK